jgi:hypothetical protein
MVEETEFELSLNFSAKTKRKRSDTLFAGCRFGAWPRTISIHEHDPLFWITTHKAMLVAPFASLSRVFDQKSEHNLDRMIRVAAADLTIFSKDALQSRREAHISKAKLPRRLGMRTK